MKIVITTPSYPPEIGGPSQYAKHLFEEFTAQGHEVTVARYTYERNLPTGIRHFAFFGKVFYSIIGADYVLSLDTFGIAVPTILAARILGSRVVVRIGGDFLWEGYVERTSNLVTLRSFYEKTPLLSLKEKVVFTSTKYFLKLATKLVFTTSWQQKIWAVAYGFKPEQTTVIENVLSPQEPGTPYVQKNFVWATRPLKLKNGRLLYRAFADAKRVHPDIILDDGRYPYDVLMERIKSAYAVILPSISDVSPNLITDAIHYGKPFIMTKESGYADQFKDVGLLVDPFSEQDITEKILRLVDNYDEYRKKSENYTLTHSYGEIASEYLKLYNKLK